TNQAAGVWISQNFVLSVVNVDDPNQNDQITEWSGVQPTGAVITEMIGVSDQEFIDDPEKSIKLATFKPFDVDGEDFEYFVAPSFSAESYSSAWTFFDIDSEGVLTLRYKVDYESTLYSPIIEVIIFAWGTSDGDAIGDAAVWPGAISQHFTLSILNVDEDGINDSLTSWSGSQPTNFAISETAGVVNQEEITDPASYVAVATFTPKDDDDDDDGDQFEYGLGGDDAGLFDIGSDGILKVKYELDYEFSSSRYWLPVIETTVWARGTAGGDAVGDGAVWISQNFTLTIVNIAEDGDNTNATEWSGTQPTLAVIDEDVTIVGDIKADKPPQAIATFTATDADADADGYSDGFHYVVGGDDAWMFEIDSEGVLYVKVGFNYEAPSSVGENISITIWATGRDGGTPSGDALTTGIVDGWITQNFVLSIADVAENYHLTEWDGTAPTGATLLETIDVDNQGELTEANYVAVATLIPADPDGNDFQYAIQEYKDQFWLFDIGSDGVLKVKYDLDYESAWYSPIVGVTIWANGISGNPYTNANSAVWVSHNFTLTIINVDDTNLNDEATKWSGEQTTIVAVSETAGVENLRFDLTTGEYKAVATFTPTDGDGDQFQYGLSGDYAWMFDIDKDGVLKLKFELD
ncbi:MAG: hypothetical protein ACR2PV_02055, partial [Gammaproteobacteria bacterium]